MNPEPHNKNDNPKKPFRFSYPLLGISMPLCLLIGFLLGRFLDKRFATGPVFLIIFTLLGIIAGYAQLFQINKRS